MKNSKEILDKLGIKPRISFKDKQPHTFTLKNWKIDKITDASGIEKQGVKFLVSENKEDKTFFTTSLSLIEQLARYNENESVTVEMKTKSINGKMINVYEVKPPASVTITGGNTITNTITEEDIADIFPTE